MAMEEIAKQITTERGTRMKKAIGVGVVGLALLLASGCGAEESTEVKPKVEEEATQAPAPAEPSVDVVGEYDAEIQIKMNDLSLTLGDFSTVMTKGGDVAVLTTPEYLAEVQAVSDRMLGEIQAIKSMSVPAERQEVHDRLVDAISHFEIVATDIPGAVEAMDANRIFELTDEMLTGNDKIVDLTADLEGMM
jgi:hypothetical protein